MSDLLMFNDTLTLQSLLGTTTLTGTLDVTYGATPSVTATLTVGAVAGGFAAQTFQSTTVSQTGFDGNGVPTYQLLGSNA